MFNLSSLKPNPGARKKAKRLGIGEGSGNGKTSGKGQKGQTSRSGFGLSSGFEGGQMPLHRRLPKVGFTSRKKVTGVNVFCLISTDTLVDLDLNGKVTTETLFLSGLVKKTTSQVKILCGEKDLQKSIELEVSAISKSAREKIEKAGGSITLL